MTDLHGDFEVPDDQVVVLFGATGDLARRKVLPGLFHLAMAKLLPEDFRIIGSSRRNSSMSDDDFRDYAKDAATRFGRTPPDGEDWERFAARLSFAAAEPGDADDLVAAVARAEKEVGGEGHRLYHLSIPPNAVPGMVEMLGATGLSTRARVICEKPFGVDFDSAHALNELLEQNFGESQIFRIDHFLGKESVDNILALRFANRLFEPVWNRDHVSYVQIDVPETLTIEGRGAFYEGTGAFRDMVVTHLFQVLAFVAMEQPTSLEAKPLRDEVAKVFDSLCPIDPTCVVRGQYEGYLDEPGVAPDSTTETFVALKAEIESPRWKGTPFFLRTGKALAESRQVVTVGFHEPVVEIFPVDHHSRRHRRNHIVTDFADPGSIHTYFLAKRPGPEMRLGPAEMTFRYEDSFCESNGLTPYEHLILLAMVGDQSLFTRADGIERLWRVATPLLESPPAVEPYAQGSWGPESSHRLIEPDRWFLPQEGGRSSSRRSHD
ncbi:MAG TPA: glucose-6-phosphate dehydrogenase [Acidimicrobiales bacterium]|nr:glucose-6-phosphate dehydrogenase [Acidimicrobiales bacterium]